MYRIIKRNGHQLCYNENTKGILGLIIKIYKMKSKEKIEVFKT